MNPKKQLTILEFSRLTGIKRENLRFYDRIGLLCPDTRGENNYRYYSRHQLNTAYLIASLRGLGIGIEAIKHYAAHRTPENTLALFAQQSARIEQEMEQLRVMSRIVQMRSDMIRQALVHGDNALFLEQKAEEPLFLCPPIPLGMDDAEAGLFSYDHAEANGINLEFPSGTLVAQQRLQTGDAAFADRYFFRVDSGGNASQPGGLYAVAYGWCTAWDVEALYQRLLSFIEQQGLGIRGGAYEDYPFNDIPDQTAQRYCVRVEIPVEGHSDQGSLLGNGAKR